MTWGTFIGAIAYSNITKESQPKILIRLFKIAGSIAEPSQSSANHWIYNRRTCKVNSYFPNGNIDHEKGVDVFNYFRKRSKTSLEALRNAFCPVNDDKIIKCDTNNADTFCWSILNQFLGLLGFQLLDEPVWEGDITPEQSSETPIPNMPLSQAENIVKPDSVDKNGQEDNSYDRIDEFIEGEKFLRILRVFVDKYRIDEFLKNKPIILRGTTTDSNADNIKAIDENFPFECIFLGIDEDWITGAKRFITTIKKNILEKIDFYGYDPFLINIKNYITPFIDSLESFVVKIQKDMEFYFDGHWLSLDENMAMWNYEQIIQHHK